MIEKDPEAVHPDVVHWASRRLLLPGIKKPARSDCDEAASGAGIDACLGDRKREAGGRGTGNRRNG